MTKTYCGKDCEQCAFGKANGCPGCQNGPGGSGECELAQCCRSKGHQSCDTCNFMQSCTTLHNREQLPIWRQQRRERREEEQQRIDRNAQLLGKWLWVLFWLIIPSAIGSLMTNDTILTLFPQLEVPGQIINILCSVAYMVILLKISPVERDYRTAGICYLLGVVMATLVLVLIDAFLAVSILALPMVIVSIVAEYYEMHAHAAVLYGVDDELAAKWLKLWRWNLYTYGAMIASLVLMIVVAMLGLLVLMAAMIALIVVSICKLVYLYRTAKLFWEKAQSLQN